jgi:hypothetical protein
MTNKKYGAASPLASPSSRHRQRHPRQSKKKKSSGSSQCVAVKRYRRDDDDDDDDDDGGDKENHVGLSSSALSSSLAASIPPSLVHALAKYEKQFQSLSYDRFPLELCGRSNLDLSAWTLVVSDACLDGIATKYSSAISSPLEKLNLRGGDKLTDAGLRRIALVCQQLTALSLENCFRLTDGGLKSVAQSCPDLEELNVSGCMGISATGFAILGDCNPQLRSLQVSGCRQIKPWTFMKIFEGCRLLRELDVSFCPKITDAEIKLLSDCCVAMERLNLRDCIQVSDVGVLSLSQGCQHLADLNLSRSDMPFKITDVALMALGQSCADMKSLTLRGCSSVSDAGISWLSKGCPKLEKIDLTNCYRVTNGGIRYLGEECSGLKTVVLTNLKHVSDVGVRSLGEGCPQLENLVLAGVYLLSDGIQRDFGFEGMQAMSKSSCAKHIRSLNVHGCFQMQTVALASIGRFLALENLVLSGCTKLSADGIAQLAKSCTQISNLSLAGCGDCLSDASMALLAHSMKHLVNVSVSDCRKVGKRSFAALSTCSKLRRLDASGCAAVTDDAVMALCSGSGFSPGLECLDLSHCFMVGDLSLTFIADGLQREGSFEVTLTKLALKGTGVEATTLKAVRDQFCYSTMRKNNAYVGFWPASRPHDRKNINEYGLRSKCATAIQAKYRAYKDWQIVHKAREHFCRKKVATLLAAYWRGRQARKLTKALQRENWIRKKTAIKLQCWARMTFARKAYQTMQHQRWLSVAPFAAVSAQRTFRGWLGRRKAKKTKLGLLALLAKMEVASLVLQTFGRVVIAKQELHKLIVAREEMERIRHASAAALQCSWRQLVARRILYFRRTARDATLMRQNWAARTIQICFWTCRLRLVIWERVESTKTRLGNVITIQQWIRERNAHITENARQAALYEALRERSSVVIQCRARKYMACSFVEQQRECQRIKLLQREEKALILTSWWRGCLAQCHVWELKRLQQEKIRREIKVQHWAASIIASSWRGKMGRDKAKSARVAKMERWKELWSKEEERSFYYNQFTGETRWRKPQALLDLEPRPVCSNCNYYEAENECADCVEFFCHQCWQAVHYGGRRAQHKFRCLYDYYGKRVDYGDGIFPSLWPTDIEQDDRNGWRKRPVFGS